MLLFFKDRKNIIIVRTAEHQIWRKSIIYHLSNGTFLHIVNVYSYTVFFLISHYDFDFTKGDEHFMTNFTKNNIFVL